MRIICSSETLPCLWAPLGLASMPARFRETVRTLGLPGILPPGQERESQWSPARTQCTRPPKSFVLLPSGRTYSGFEARLGPSPVSAFCPGDWLFRPVTLHLECSSRYRPSGYPAGCVTHTFTLVHCRGTVLPPDSPRWPVTVPSNLLLHSYNLGSLVHAFIMN